MRKLISVMAIAAASVVTTAAFAQVSHAVRPQAFASDLQTVPVMANLPGLGGTFQSYVAIYNPTATAYSVTATLYDSNGIIHAATIPLAAGEVKTYQNFLDAVFAFSGGGAVTFSAPSSPGGQHNNRFIINTEVRTGGTHYSTSVPVLEFAGSNSPSFAPGINVDATTRTNAGCWNQSTNANVVTVTALDNTGKTVGTTSLTLPPSGWGQAPINANVSNGTARFDPSDSAVCYAVVVDNTTNDGRFVSAAEYQP